MGIAKRNIKVVIYSDDTNGFGVNSKIGDMCVDVEYPVYNAISNCYPYDDLQQFKKNIVTYFKKTYGVDILYNLISLVNNDGIPTTPFEVEKTHIQESVAVRLFSKIRKLKINSIIGVGDGKS